MIISPDSFLIVLANIVSTSTESVFFKYVKYGQFLSNAKAKTSISGSKTLLFWYYLLFSFTVKTALLSNT